jgi:hypothetical protein
MGGVVNRNQVDLGGSLQIDVARRRQKLRLWPAGEGRLTRWWQLK